MDQHPTRSARDEPLDFNQTLFETPTEPTDLGALTHAAWAFAGDDLNSAHLGSAPLAADVYPIVLPTLSTSRSDHQLWVSSDFPRWLTTANCTGAGLWREQLFWRTVYDITDAGLQLRFPDFAVTDGDIGYYSISRAALFFHQFDMLNTPTDTWHQVGCTVRCKRSK